jgi:hypothetical protein
MNYMTGNILRPSSPMKGRGLGMTRSELRVVGL